MADATGQRPVTVAHAALRISSEELHCVVKSEHYGQCRPVKEDVRDGWDGTIVDYQTNSAAKPEEVNWDPVMDIYNIMTTLSVEVRYICTLYRFFSCYNVVSHCTLHT